MNPKIVSKRLSRIMAKEIHNGWSVYILQCADKTLYTGVTNDLAARLAKHQDGKGAKYTRGRGPCVLVYTEPHGTKSGALKRERQIKAMKRNQKLSLVGQLIDLA